MVAEHLFFEHPFLGVFYFYQSVQLFIPKIIGIAWRRMNKANKPAVSTMKGIKPTLNIRKWRFVGVTTA